MPGLKAKTKDAQKAKEYLLRHGLFDRRYKIFGKGSFIYLPFSGASAEQLAELKRLGSISNATFHSASRGPDSYRGLLKRELGDKAYASASKGYDLFGNIAVIDAPKGIARKVAKALMLSNSNAETVLMKEGAVRGRYRTRSYSHVMGIKNYVATYRENGCTFRFDIRKVFFSTRLAYERLRIAKLAKSRENVLVMFAGVGPFAIEIAKARADANVVAVELNRAACGYMLENIRINGTANVTAVCGDAKKLGRKYSGFADRIVMPLPKDSYGFLGAVNRYARDGCIVHYYAFGEAGDAFVHHSRMIKEFFGGRGKRARILGRRVVRPYSAHEVEIALDFSISKKD